MLILAPKQSYENSLPQKTLERQFRGEAFLARLLEKIFERCPLKHKLTRALSSLWQIEISTLKPDALKLRFGMLVQLLHDDGWISSTAAEKAEKQYSQMIQNKDFLNQAKKFNINDRVDDFYSRILDSGKTVDLRDLF